MKPQTAWMLKFPARRYNQDNHGRIRLWPGYGGETKYEVIANIETGFRDRWLRLYRKGWRVVRVEIREVKK